MLTGAELFDDGVFWSTPVLSDGLHLLPEQSRRARVSRSPCRRRPSRRRRHEPTYRNDERIRRDAAARRRNALAQRGTWSRWGPPRRIATAIGSMTLHCGFEMLARSASSRRSARSATRAPNSWSAVFTLSADLGGARGRAASSTAPERLGDQVRPRPRADGRRDRVRDAEGLHRLARRNRSSSDACTDLRTDRPRPTFDDRACYEVQGTTAQRRDAVAVLRSRRPDSSRASPAQGPGRRRAPRLPGVRRSPDAVVP